VAEQFRGGVKGIRHRRRIGLDTGRTVLILTEDEPTADRVVGAFEDALALVVVGGEEHRVGVERQALAPVQDDVGVGVEGDLAAPGQGKPAGLPDPGDQRLGGHRVHRLRVLAGEPEHERLHAAVAVPGGAERAEQFHPQPGHPRHQALGGQRLGEHARRPHRPDRMRARRADPDLEKLERADRHGPAPFCGTAPLRYHVRPAMPWRRSRARWPLGGAAPHPFC